MKHLLWSSAAIVIVAAGLAGAQDIVYKPIDTNKFVVKPSKAAASIAAKTIDLAGTTTAGAISGNGFVKTINNLLSRKIRIPTTQNGPSPLPTPNQFQSTFYKSYNTPVMPTIQRR
ncbi:MAG TPA: hypothetical protein VLM40_07495 [Gemmata sp.]|nr:hypothetical protein [Gemmata sp.]